MSKTKLPIFEGLPEITADAAMELAYYWRVAGGDAVGIIDNLGCLHYGKNGQDTWERPIADRNFKILKEAFWGSENPAILVKENRITVDFGKLQYNLSFVKDIMQKYGLGVCDSDRGLMFYEPKESNGTIWYLESDWRFRRVGVKDLGLTESRLSALSANMENPRTAEWKTLYFAAA